MRCCCVVVSFAPVLFVSVSRPTAPACCAGSTPGPTGPEDCNNKRILTCRPRTARRRKRPPGGPGPQTPACNYDSTVTFRNEAERLLVSLILMIAFCDSSNKYQVCRLADQVDCYQYILSRCNHLHTTTPTIASNIRGDLADTWAKTRDTAWDQFTKNERAAFPYTVRNHVSDFVNPPQILCESFFRASGILTDGAQSSVPVFKIKLYIFCIL